MPALGNALDFSKYEGRNFRAHQLGTAPSSPVTGQLYYNTADNTLYWWDGTVWVAAEAGPGAPTGPAGGDLSGTYPNPQIATGVIVDADVNGANKDGLTTVPSLRTLGAGAQQAMPGDRTLNAITAPTGNVNMNGKLINNLADPVAALDGANKQYVDNTASGLDAKASCKAATTANVALTGTQTIDGIALVANDRVLVKNQTAPAENGIYTVAAGAWARGAGTNTWNELVSAYTWVEQGTANADTGWVCTVDQGGTLGTTAVTWVQFTAAGAAIAGAGLTKTGNTFDVGAGTGISVAADTVGLVVPVSVANGGTGGTTPAAGRVAIGAAGYYSSATHTAGTSIAIPAATHGLRASRGLLVQVQEEATGLVVMPDINVAANGDVTVTFGASVSSNTYRTTIIG